MIEIEVLALLKGCSELITLLGGERIYPYDTDQINSLIYRVVPLSSDKVKETYRLELISVLKDDYTALQIREALKNLLVTMGDSPLTEHIMKCVQVGGSSPIFNESTQTYHTKTNFELIRRV